MKVKGKVRLKCAEYNKVAFLRRMEEKLWQREENESPLREGSAPSTPSSIGNIILIVVVVGGIVLLSLLSGPSQHHGPALQEFVEWCESSCLELNVSKTKEMVGTFSNRQIALATASTTSVHRKPVELVEECK